MDGIDISSMSMEAKINLILSKVVANDTKMDSMKLDLTQQISSLNNTLTQQIKQVDKRVSSVINDCHSNTDAINSTNNELTLLRDEVKILKINEINRDVHSRRFNMVFGNIEDNGGWEAQGTSTAKVRELLHSINLQEYNSDGNEMANG